MDNIIQLNGSKDIVDIIKAKIGGEFMLAYIDKNCPERDACVYISNDLNSVQTSWLLKTMDAIISHNIMECHIDT